MGFKRLKEHGRKWEKVTDAKVGGVIQEKMLEQFVNVRFSGSGRKL